MIRLGIIGTGRIAKRFVPEALCVEGLTVTAVYNPHKGSAERFVQAVCREKEVLGTDDPDAFWDLVDAVYIASPHETHADYIQKSLDRNKHVLCEKPLALKRADAEACFSYAKEKGLVLMEGIKTAYCPGYRKVLELARSGMIGEIRYIDSCFTKLEKAERRELTDIKYGGSFTELGSYVMLPIFDLADELAQPVFSSVYDEKGIDLFTRVSLSGAQCMASAECGLGVKSEGRLLIGGTKGFIKVDAPWWKTRKIEVHFEDESKTMYYDESFEGDGLRYEIAAFVDLIRNGKSDATNSMSKERSIWMAEQMEQFLTGREDDRKQTSAGGGR